MIAEHGVAMVEGMAGSSRRVLGEGASTAELDPALVLAL